MLVTDAVPPLLCADVTVGFSSLERPTDLGGAGRDSGPRARADPARAAPCQRPTVGRVPAERRHPMASPERVTERGCLAPGTRICAPPATYLCVAQ